MNFTYNIIYNTPYTYNGSQYSFDPNLPVPVPIGDPDYGKSLQTVLGMTDQEVAGIVLAAKWIQVKEIRDKLLVESDWTQGADVPNAIKSPWSEYRTVLRNIPQNFSNPDDVVFPDKP
jgi:hypothetical protein